MNVSDDQDCPLGEAPEVPRRTHLIERQAQALREIRDRATRHAPWYEDGMSSDVLAIMERLGV